MFSSPDARGSSFVFRCVFALLILVGLEACKKKTSIAPPPELASLSTEEANGFGERLATYLNECKQLPLRDSLDMVAVSRRAVSGTPLELKIPTMDVEIMGNRILDEFVSKFCGPTFKATFLHLHERDGRQTALIRLRSDEGLNYFELYVGKNAQGEAMVDDVFVFHTGETMSQTLRGSLTAALATPDEGRKAAEVLALFETDPDRALARLDEIPPSLRNLKAIQTRILHALSRGDDKDYMAAIESYQEMYPNDPSLDLFLLDYYAMKEDYSKVMTHLERLDKTVGGDPVLSGLMAVTLTQSGTDWPRAVALASAAVQADPGARENYDTLLASQLGAKDYEAALQTMNKMLVAFDHYVSPESLQDLMSSPEELTSHPGWEAYHAAYLSRMGEEALKAATSE